MVLVRLEAGGKRALGYTYADTSTAKLVETLLHQVVLGQDAFAHGAILQAMWRAVRNLGETGIAMMAISAIDNALWDLRARLLDVPLVSLLGRVRDSDPGLRQRRLYLVHRRATHQATRRLGASRASPWSR